MSPLRRHFRWLSALVVAALLMSPIARAHCYAIKNIGAQLAAAGNPPCHTAMAKASGATKQQSKAKHETWHDCPVCLALAHSMAGSSGLTELAKPSFAPAAASSIGGHAVTVASLHLGGLGSRAPPA